MSLARIHARAALGLDAPLVTVEVHVAGGLPALTIVGLPAAAVREARDRVRAALQNCGFGIPPRRITVNLAPAELPKDGGRFDLAIALGVLLASGQIEAGVEGREFLGELSLSGELRPVPAALPAALQSAAAGSTLVLPAASAAEAAVATGARLRAAKSLLEVVAWLCGQGELAVPVPAPPAPTAPAPDLAEVRGQAQAKRALEIAAAGGHSLLMAGPPGSGKSMLAQRLPGLLPRLDDAAATEVAAIHSVARNGHTPAWAQPPLRAPHHTASAVALVGGGSVPRPGEISLAHRGVLFLDELPEFSRPVLEVLREPLENGSILISRAARQAQFPARFLLVAAMNPCPCGYLGDSAGHCHCSPEQVARYRSRISGPLLDRIDLQLSVARVSRAELFAPAPAGEGSAAVRERVRCARERQYRRQGLINAELLPGPLERACGLDEEPRRLLETAVDRLGLSARSAHRILRVARTIADLAGEGGVAAAHVAEAIQLRQLDRAVAA